MVLSINGAEWLGSTSELVKWCQMNDWCFESSFKDSAYQEAFSANMKPRQSEGWK